MRRQGSQELPFSTARAQARCARIGADFSKSWNALKGGCYLKDHRESTKPLKPVKPWHVVIVGAGRVGQTLGRLLSARGYVIDAVVCRSYLKARAARRFTRAHYAATTLSTALFETAQIVFVTTPDQQVKRTAQKLAPLKMNWRHKMVFHSSGTLSSHELAPLKKQGAIVASLHPLQTFPSPAEGIRRTRGIYFTFEGDARAKALAKKIVRDLGGQMVKIHARHKPLYHCAGSFACGGLLAPLGAAYALYEKIGIDETTARAMLRPMVDATLDVGQSSNLRKSITGPISRGDAATIARHLAALKQTAPAFIELYKSLSLHLLDLLGSKLSPAQIRQIRQVLIESPSSFHARSRKHRSKTKAK